MSLPDLKIPGLQLPRTAASAIPEIDAVEHDGLARSERLLAWGYLPIALAMVFLVPAGHPFLIWPAAAAIGVYLLQGVIRLPLPDGYASIVQPAFVVLLFAIPLNLVALVVPLALFASTVISDRRPDPLKLVFSCVDAWYCIPPVIIVGCLAPGQFYFHHWPVYVAALAGELAISVLGPIVRVAIYRENLSISPMVFILPAAIDVLLTPLGAAAAHAGTGAAEETVMVLATVLALVALLGHERTERIVYERMALRDPLTGLANRALFDELLTSAERRIARSGESGALLFIDLNHFKQVNDDHGHLAGDIVLKTTAARIEDVVRGADTVARFGGDEFAVLLAEPMTTEGIERVAGAITRAVRMPIALPDGSTVSVTASVGIAALRADDVSPEDVVARADEAMYEAKAVAHARGE